MAQPSEKALEDHSFETPIPGSCACFSLPADVPMKSASLPERRACTTIRRFWQRLMTYDRASLFGWLCVAIITTVYTVIVFNRFMPPQEGWFNAFSRRILDGQMPYRDFYLFLQPVYAYMMAALNAVFGYDFIVFRTYGILERLLLASILYLILRKAFKPWIAAFGAVAGLVFSWSFNADVIYSYYQFSLALVLLSLLLLIQFFSVESPRRQSWYLVTAGLACSLGFMTKQTLGLAFPAVAAALIVLHSVRNGGTRGTALKRIALYAAGFVSVIALFLVVLLATGSFGDYVSQVYQGTSSKGALPSILFGAIGRLFDSHLRWALLFLLVLRSPGGLSAAGSRFVAKWCREWVGRLGGYENYVCVVAMMLLTLSLVLPRFFLPFFEASQLNAGGVFDIKRALVYALFPISIGLSAFYLHRTLFKSKEALAKLGIAVTSFTIMYVHGFSGVIEEQSVVLIFSLLVGLALSYPGAAAAIKQVTVIAAVCTVTLVCSVQKMTWPYGWWGWYEPSISAANSTLAIPHMSGLTMSEGTANMYQTVYDSLNGKIEDDEYIYTFPHIKAFDNTFGTIPPTFCDVHYWDVCPDWVALADSRVLQADPPKAIVYMDLTEEAWKVHEDLFRGGAESGQRAIARFIDEGIESGRYRVLAEIPAYEEARILVLLREDAD
jgi:hypothetical protein